MQTFWLSSSSSPALSLILLSFLTWWDSLLLDGPRTQMVLGGA